MPRKVLSQFFLSAAVLFTSQARTYWVDGDKFHLGDLIFAEAFPNEGLSKIGGVNVDKIHRPCMLIAAWVVDKVMSLHR